MEGFEVKAGGGPWKPATLHDAVCGEGCSFRYRYALRKAARALDDVDVASEEGDVIEAPPSAWLVWPEDAPKNARVRLRVATTPATTFVTGLHPSPEVPHAWDIAVEDMWTTPYSAFGPLRVRAVSEGAVTLAVAPGKMRLTDDELATWTGNAARAIRGYLGSFPMSDVVVLVIPSRGRWIGEGKTLAGGGGTIFIRVGETATTKALANDWVLVHEMTHLAFPSVPRNQMWAEEGLATYVEPFARARAGLTSPEEAWAGLVEGAPNGIPAPGDRGLDHTPSWGLTYWGGALFYLQADIEIRKRTNGKFGLEHALRGVLDDGGNNAHRWSLERAFAAGDRATGTSVLTDLHADAGAAPHPIDLDTLWKDLGIIGEGKTVRFDDRAPLAAIRRTITSDAAAH